MRSASGPGQLSARLIADQFNGIAGAAQQGERSILAQTRHEDLGQYLAGIRTHVCLFHEFYPAALT